MKANVKKLLNVSLNSCGKFLMIHLCDVKYQKLYL